MAGDVGGLEEPERTQKGMSPTPYFQSIYLQPTSQRSMLEKLGQFSKFVLIYHFALKRWQDLESLGWFWGSRETWPCRGGTVDPGQDRRGTCWFLYWSFPSLLIFLSSYLGCSVLMARESNSFLLCTLRKFIS